MTAPDASPAPSPRRTAVVTGSESGIGRATAVALAEAGFDIGVTWFRDEADGRRTARLVRDTGRRAVLAHLDLADAPACGDVVDALADDLGGLDVFVNNAGAGGSGRLVDMAFAEWRATMAVDLDGAFVCIQRAARRMVAQGRGGRIVAVTSVHEHQAGGSAYTAAKHGLGGLMKTAAVELGRYGITANSVAPGEIATAMNGMAPDGDRAEPAGTGLDGEGARPAQGASTDTPGAGGVLGAQAGPDARPDRPAHPLDVHHRPGIPLARPGSVREVADVIVFLASPGAGYVTGASWAVDGGMMQMAPLGGALIATDGWRG